MDGGRSIEVPLILLMALREEEPVLFFAKITGVLFTPPAIALRDVDTGLIFFFLTSFSFLLRGGNLRSFFDRRG